MNMKLVEQINNSKTPVQRHVRFIRRRVKKPRFMAFLGVFTLLVGLCLSLFLFYKISRWYDSYKVVFKSPIVISIKFNKIMSIEKRIEPTIISPLPKIATPSPTLKPKLRTEKETVLAMKHGEILWKIYGLESSYGKNDICRPEKFGGFGVMYNGKVVCYDTFSKAVERAEYWITSLGVDKDLATALCTWNTGIKQPNCLYFQSYLSL